MDKRYEVFCLADRHFYETPARLANGQQTGDPVMFETAQRPVPDGWGRSRHGDWLNLQPSGARVPAQGWKIHVSACLDNADKTAARVWEYCVPRGIPFKFVPTRRELFLRNSKYADRGSSGKFATIYPVDEEQLHTVLRELDEVLRGEPGPYVLTDLRWNDGPLYVRYGAFQPRYCADDTGALVPAIEDGEGRLVPDRRAPSFQVPAWVKLPAFLEPQLAARAATTVADLPYRIERALHFSNGGGVYAGTDTRTGEQVVLKEARPHAGLAADGADAVARLERERDALERLAGLPSVPALRDWIEVGEHRFLVMDLVPGRPLNSYFAERLPLLAADPDPEAVAEHTRWALRVSRLVEEAVAGLHDRGVVMGDLHMFNVMMAPDEESVALLDFEAATCDGEQARQAMAHPGFMAPADRTGFAIDRYALACLRLALFLPLTTLLAIEQGKAAHLARIIAERYPQVPRAFLDEAVAEITGTPPATTPASGEFVPAADWPRSRDAMATAILASATPERDDRLFPGDIAQFSDGGGLGLAHGAAGVLLALAETGAGRYEEGERWLLEHAADPPRGTPPGLYDGLIGVAYALDRLGHTEAAVDLAGNVLTERWDRLGVGLFDGLAGLGLALDHLTDRQKTFGASALEAARLAAERLREAPPKRTGLLRGATGAALLFLRLYERTGDPELLDQAAAALRTDLDRCVTGANGGLQVDEGWRTMPYLGAGSVGIGMVIDDYLAHRADEEFERARAAILPAACSQFYVQPGLFRGRAGMVLHLGRTTAPGRPPGALEEQIAGLDWYAMPYAGGLAFPGDQMMRLSMDLATGTAGVLLALGAALHSEPVGLPFLPPPSRRDPEPAPNPGS